MNIYEKTIKDLQDRVRALESRLTPCDGAVAEPKKWSPIGGTWHIDANGIFRNSISTKNRREFGTERPTQQQAERAAVEMRRFNRLLALRDELCEGEIGDGIEKFHITYLVQDARWFSTSGYPQYDGVHVHFTTNRAAQRACDMLNSGEVEL